MMKGALRKFPNCPWEVNLKFVHDAPWRSFDIPAYTLRRRLKIWTFNKRNTYLKKNLIFAPESHGFNFSEFESLTLSRKKVLNLLVRFSSRNSNDKITVYDTIYFKFFFTLTSLTADRLSFVQVTTDRKLDWIVPDRTRSYQVKPDRRFVDLLRYKILSYIFTIFNIWSEPIKMLNQKR